MLRHGLAARWVYGHIERDTHTRGVVDLDAALRANRAWPPPPCPRPPRALIPVNLTS
ncbi:hypothetical protein NX774_08135 [Massilia agilis]|uniref:Uncharacterized protein n=1 Tax=Massilia agilis TaxID=1811226 RepID=A0ABT2D9B8_9BURK|nr:hypothetical protein [Massilia agilis]MCS0807890.1 hypothetical protein [Massilia agilis]